MPPGRGLVDALFLHRCLDSTRRERRSVGRYGRRNGGKRRPCRDDGDGELVRYCASARKADRDCNTEPPASPYAIMRRVHPYRGENSGPGKDIVGKLDTQTRN